MWAYFSYSSEQLMSLRRPHKIETLLGDAMRFQVASNPAICYHYVSKLPRVMFRYTVATLTNNSVNSYARACVYFGTCVVLFCDMSGRADVSVCRCICSVLFDMRVCVGLCVSLKSWLVCVLFFTQICLMSLSPFTPLFSGEEFLLIPEQKVPGNLACTS